MLDFSPQILDFFLLWFSSQNMLDTSSPAIWSLKQPLQVKWVKWGKKELYSVDRYFGQYLRSEP